MKEPEISDEIWAEAETILAPNPTTAAADSEPLISFPIWAELDTTSAIFDDKCVLENEPEMSAAICAELLTVLLGNVDFTSVAL